MSTYQTLKLEVSGRVARLALNRPDTRNAFNAEMIGELSRAFKELSQMQDVSILVLTGEGKSFCAGADLGYMQAMAKFTLEENEADARTLDQMFWALRSVPQAVIAKLHGHVMGGAVGLTALCDIAAAVEGTQFCFSEARLGLVPAVISPYVLEKMNAGAARRYMLSAEVFGAKEALSAGLVEFAGAEAEVDAFIAKTIQALSQNGPDAVRATKQLLREIGTQPNWPIKRAVTSRVIAERRVSAEGQEGLRGFLEKRDPSWKAGQI